MRMKMNVFFSILACKLSRSMIRLLGRGGTDFPGRIALKLCPNLLGVLAKDVTTVIVTGTNGKTTTSRMIEQSWADSGISYFANKTGANLLSGVTAEFAVHSSLTGRCRYTHALIEADEAAFKFIARFVDARAVVVTNVFRDQLDRYGEVTHTLDNIRIGIENSERNDRRQCGRFAVHLACGAGEKSRPVLWCGHADLLRARAGALRCAVLHPLRP